LHGGTAQNGRAWRATKVDAAYLSRRIWASVVDGAILAVALYPFFSNAPWPAIAIGVAFRLGFHYFAHATPGKYFFHLTVAPVSARFSVLRLALRDGFFVAAAVSTTPEVDSLFSLAVTGVAVVDLGCGLVRRDHRTVHDFVGGTVVVEERTR